MMKDIIVTALYNLGYILIFPGFLFCFFAGLLLCGIDRKLVAKMQKRVGPPVLQPFYDFFKLFYLERIYLHNIFNTDSSAQFCNIYRRRFLTLGVPSC